MNVPPSRWHASLLRTKLFMPPARSGSVARPRLIKQLDDALRFGHKLILISAPPGFGKTTLISEWLSRLSDSVPSSYAPPSTPPAALTSDAPPSPLPAARSVAWLSLDSADNDPAHFFLYLCAALDLATGAHEEWDEIVPLLQASAPPPLPVIVASMLNVCARLDLSLTAPLLVVLEDFHAVENDEIQRALAYWLDHIPPHLHLIITSRADPPLPLSRLRARAQLTELRAADLRFRPEEAVELIQLTMPAPLPPEHIAALDERTEGWAAGLHLAALALAAQPHSDAAGTREFINAFTGSHRYVMDYLVEEVLSRESPKLQNFLLHTSILDRMSAPLCQFILEPDNDNNRHSSISNRDALYRTNLQSLLEDLDRRNLFVIALDEQREWYRYHHLFSQVLRHRLHQTDPSSVQALQDRASSWFQAQGLTAEAIQYALAAQDQHRAAELIADEAERLLERGEHATLLAWLDKLSDETLRAYPDLSLHHAAAYLITHNLNGAQAAVHDAELAIDNLEDADVRERLAGRAAGIGAMVALNRNDVPRTITLGRQALEHLGPEQARLRSAVLLHIGVAYDWTGDVLESEQSLVEAHQLAEKVGDMQTALLALANLGAAKRTQARYRQAAELFRTGLQLEERHNAYHLTGGIYLYTDLADTHIEWNELAAARPLLQEALQRCERFGLIRAQVVSRRLWARWLAASGQPAQAQEAVTQAIDLALEHALPNHYAAPARALRARLWFEQGETARAVEWAHTLDWEETAEMDVKREEEYLMLIRVWIYEMEYARAASLLERLLEDAADRGRTESVIWALRLQALNYAAQQDMTQAFNTLERALVLAQPEGFIRTFVEEGETMRTLLHQFHTAHPKLSPPMDAYLNRLDASFVTTAPGTPAQPAPSPAPSEPLTDRERQVLGLAAQGLSDKQIAAQLVVALGTVKRHLNNIYNKFGVNSRTQAVLRARQAGMLDT